MIVKGLGVVKRWETRVEQEFPFIKFGPRVTFNLLLGNGKLPSCRLADVLEVFSNFRTIAQFRYIKIQPETINITARFRGINPHKFYNLIPRASQ